MLKLVNFLVDGWQPFIVFKTESVITCAVEFLRTFLVVIINLSHVFFNARGNPLFLNFFRIQIRDLQFLSKNLASNLRNAVLWESFVLQKWLMACLFWCWWKFRIWKSFFVCTRFHFWNLAWFCYNMIHRTLI